MSCKPDRHSIETALRAKLDSTGSALGTDLKDPGKRYDYEKAVKRFNDFILYGKVPLDMTGDAVGISSGG